MHFISEKAKNTTTLIMQVMSFDALNKFNMRHLLPADVHGVETEVWTADAVHDNVKVYSHAVVVAPRCVHEQLLRELGPHVVSELGGKQLQMKIQLMWYPLNDRINTITEVFLSEFVVRQVAALPGSL